MNHLSQIHTCYHLDLLDQGLGNIKDIHGGVAGGFVDKIYRPHLQRPECDLSSLAGQGADHEDRDRVLPHDPIECLKAVHIRHLHIECDHIGLQALDLRYGFNAVPCLSDDLDHGIGTQHPLHGLSDKGRVIHH